MLTLNNNEINYDDLNLSQDASFTTFEWNGHNIEIFNYLSAENKYDIIMITLQEADEDGYYNPFKIDVFFHMNLFLSYIRNINVPWDKNIGGVDKIAFYDELQSSGLMDAFLKHINEDEYNYLYDMMEKTCEAKFKYESSFNAMLRSIILNLPENAGKAVEILQKVNPEQMQELFGLAKSMGFTNNLVENVKENLKK